MTELEMKRLDRVHSALMVFTTVTSGFLGTVFAAAIHDNPWKWGSICAVTAGVAYPIVACALSPKLKFALEHDFSCAHTPDQNKDVLTVAQQPQEKKDKVSEPERVLA